MGKGNMIRHKRTIPWIIFLLALGVRSLYVFQIDSSPLFDHPPVDGMTYVQHAARLAAGNWLGLGEPPFWQPPLYPYILGLHQVLFSDLIHSLRFFQILCGSLTCVLIWSIGRRLFPDTAMIAAVAALAGALYGPLIFFDGEVLPATLATFLDLAGLTLLLRCRDRPSATRYVLAGAVFGLAALTVPTVLTFVLAAAVFVWLDTRWQYPVTERIRWPLAFLVGVGLVITPAALRNSAIGGDRVLISSNAGVNFWIGTNTDYDAALDIRPGWEWDDLLARPRMEAHLEQPSAKSDFFMQESFDFIRDQPLDYARLLARKTFQLWHGEEIGRNQGIYFWRNYSPILATTLWKNLIAFPFGLVAPLALLGLMLAVRRRGGISLPVIFISAYALSVIAFFITARYRIPLIPLLLVYAAYGGHCVIQAVRHGTRLSAVLHAGALALLVALSNHGVTRMDMDGDPLIHFNLATAHSRNRDIPQAQRAYERAVQQDSTYWEAWFNLGSVLGVQRKAGAERIFERVTEAYPDRVIAWVSLARTRRAQGNRAGALSAYESGLRTNPIAFQYYGRYEELIDLYLEGGDWRDAARVLNVAARFYPEVAKYLRNKYGRRIRGLSP